ncbi:MAG: hypothetical protein JXQ93_13460 [Flavobacteriaceae bacterium]
MSNYNCELTKKEFSIDYNSYDNFKEELKDFLESKNEYDILYLFVSGGNEKKSFLKRWYLDGNKLNEIMKDDAKNTKEIVNYSYNDFIKLFNMVENESFIQTCSYSSSNDSYMILTRESSKINFKYFSTSYSYNELNKSESKKIKNALNLITYLNRLKR